MEPTTMAIGAGIQGLTSLISGMSGIFQKAKAKKMEKNNIRPEYNIPGAIEQNNVLAQSLATQGMPGYGAAKQNIQRGAANAIGQAQTRKSGLGAIGAIQQNSNDATLNLDIANATQRMNNIRGLMQQNNIAGQYQDRQWNWNQRGKYEENAAAIRALKGAGNANINNALQGVMQAGATYAGYGDLGQGGGQPTGGGNGGMNMGSYNRFRNFQNYGR